MTESALPTDATPLSHRHFAVARRTAALLAPHPGVLAIAVGGSIVRGIADEFSDLDLFVYSDAFPSEAERRALLQPLSPQRFKAHPEHERSGLVVDAFMCDETEVDLNWLQPAAVEACMRAVLVKHDLTPRIQGFVAGFADALALHGEDRCEGWRQRVLAYPETLARTIVAANLSIDPFWVPGVDSCRAGDLLVLYEAVCRVQRGVLGILLGLNRRYLPPSFKRARRLVAGLSIKPPAISERLERAFTVEVSAVSDHMRAIVHETFDLVETHMPELDVETARKRFSTNPSLDDEN